MSLRKLKSDSGTECTDYYQIQRKVRLCLHFGSNDAIHDETDNDICNPRTVPLPRLGIISPNSSSNQPRREATTPKASYLLQPHFQSRHRRLATVPLLLNDLPIQ